MATTAITSSASSISSNPITINQIETTNDKNVSSSSLSNNSTETVEDQNQNGVGSVAKSPLGQPKEAKSIIRAVLDRFKAKPTNKTATAAHDEDTPPTTTTAATTTTTTITTNDALRNLINAELNFIKNASEILKEHETNIKEVPNSLKATDSDVKLRELKKSVMKLKQQITSKSKDEYDNRNSWKDALHKVDQVEAQKLFEKMPHLYKKSTSSDDDDQNDQNEKSTFEKSLAFRDFELLYNSLSSTELKLCLLCFSVFPERVTIKKRVMIYWWIAEGFVPPMMIPFGPKTKEETANPKTEEEYANGFFDELMAKGFIEPVYEKHSFMLDGCKMHPFVRSAIIVLAERAKFFDFDQYGQLKADPSVDEKDGQSKVEFFGSLRACLLGSGFREKEDFDKLHMVFNVNEKILELKPEWFSKMKNVNVLYLGRWQTSATHHIEVEGTNFLDGLEKMKHLRFLSLQGISRITELPESISNLTNLTILDLRACHNLDKIPKGIGLLKSLTHLDISECYLLDHMPESLKSLRQLQVLKGFVAVDSKQKNACTLDDLTRLEKLRKLSINTGLEQFPGEQELRALNRMWKLQKLTIAWGRGSTTQDKSKDENGGDNVQQVSSSSAEAPTVTTTKPPAETPTVTTTKPHGRGDLIGANEGIASACGVPDIPSQLQNLNPQCSPITLKVRETATVPGNKSLRGSFTIGKGKALPNGFLELPSELQKLDLQCFPVTNPPIWLKPGLLKKLNKLYIRGGKLCDLRQLEELDCEKDVWQVKVLRLKYLTELDMNWRELRELFPEVNYVMKVKCPKLTFFPCNETGVWMGKTESESNF